MKLFYAKTLGAKLFFLAGCLMLINAIVLWLRVLNDYAIPIIWAAIPAILSLGLSVFGLFKLYAKALKNTEVMAKTGAGFALLSLGCLCLAAFWIFTVLVFGDGVLEPTPQGLLLLIGIFMVTMILAFISNVAAFYQHKDTRVIAYLLILPVSMWLLMLIVGMIKGMSVGLSLDHYTNVVIALSFLALGKQLCED